MLEIEGEDKQSGPRGRKERPTNATIPQSADEKYPSAPIQKGQRRTLQQPDSGKYPSP